jgi:hypothetical protein
MKSYLKRGFAMVFVDDMETTDFGADRPDGRSNLD